MKTKGVDYGQERKLVCQQLLKSIGIDFERELDSIFKELTDESSNHLQPEYGFVPPFMGGKDIKLFVIGQDPTIRNEERRKNIICTLNLDKQGALRMYVEQQICDNMEISIDNVYATNVFKYFYERPPADTLDVLKNHLSPNLTLLKEELNHFPKVPVITLGEPVLKLLNNDQAKVGYYWRYDSKTGTRNGEFMRVETEKSKLGRAFYPFCHQPSIRKKFYSDNLEKYAHFVIGKPE